MLRVGEIVRVPESECPLHQPEDPPKQKTRHSYTCFCIATVFHIFWDSTVGLRSENDYVMLLEPKRLLGLA